MNEYTPQWFDVFLTTIPDEWTKVDIDGVTRRLPLPEFRRVLDVCCGPGRHAVHLDRLGYDVTGIDRDANAVREARRRVPALRFEELDQRALGQLTGEFDAAVILWQSFGYFEPAANDAVLRDLASLVRPGGRLLLDVFHPGWFRANGGRTTSVRSAGCRAITNTVHDGRLTSTIEYADGLTEAMDFELFEPDELAERAAGAGFVQIEACCWWDEARPPTETEQRYQLVLERR